MSNGVLHPRKSYITQRSRETLVFARFLLIIAAALGAANHLFAQPEIQAGEAGEHARAVDALRRGEFASAVAALRSLYEQNPENEGFLHDYVVALSWSQDDTTALELEPLLNVESTPLYVIDAIAKSARNLGALEIAEKWYLRALALDPANVDYRLGLAYSYAEAKRFEDASAALQALSAEHQSTCLLKAG